MLIEGGRASDMLLVIGEERGIELGRRAFEMVKGRGYSTEELIYLSEALDHFAWLSSECEAHRIETEELVQEWRNDPDKPPPELRVRGVRLMSYFEAEHRRRIEESTATIAEMLPNVEEEVAQVRAEYRDSQLCGDQDLMARTDEEVEKRLRVHGRLGALWLLMVAAQDSRDEALSKATTAEIRATVHTEFRRRSDNL